MRTVSSSARFRSSSRAGSMVNTMSSVARNSSLAPTYSSSARLRRMSAMYICAAQARVLGDEARLNSGRSSRSSSTRRVDAQHLLVGEGHLLALERLVVDEGDGVEADVDVLGDLGHGAGLRIPVDLRIEEVLGEAELLELGHRQVVVVAAGDRVQDAALVERLEDLDHVRAEHDLAVFEQDAVPDRVVEVPDHALDGLLVFLLLLDLCLGDHVQSSWKSKRAIVICWICVLPSMISITFASRK